MSRKLMIAALGDERVLSLYADDLDQTPYEALLADRTGAVRLLASGVADLPPQRLTMVGSFAIDRATQILGVHIGDSRSGKWRALRTPLLELTRVFEPFLNRFGYLEFRRTDRSCVAARQPASMRRRWG
jgi:hypothetical protein